MMVHPAQRTTPGARPGPRGWTPAGFLAHLHTLLQTPRSSGLRFAACRARLDLPPDWTSAGTDRGPRFGWRPPAGLRREGLGQACHLSTILHLRAAGEVDGGPGGLLPDADEVAALAAWVAGLQAPVPCVVQADFPVVDGAGAHVAVRLWLPRLWLEETADGDCEIAVVLDRLLSPAAHLAEVTALLEDLTPAPGRSQVQGVGPGFQAWPHAGKPQVPVCPTKRAGAEARPYPPPVPACDFAMAPAPAPAAAADISNLIEQLRSDPATSTPLRKLVHARYRRLAPPTLDRPTLLRRLQAARPDAWLVDLQLPDGSTAVCASPELLVRCHGAVLTSTALAGTLDTMSGSLQEGDAAPDLARDPRLGPEHGLVRGFVQAALAAHGVVWQPLVAPEIHRAGPLAHLQTRLHGTRPQRLDVLTAALALHPTPALLGLPRGLALQVVTATEPRPRGWYGGCAGLLAADGSGDGEIVVLLRGVAAEADGWHGWAGAGLVAGSAADVESAEIERKFAAIAASIGGGA